MTVMIKPTVKYYSNQGVSKSTFPLTKGEQPSILHRNALLCSLHLCGEGSCCSRIMSPNTPQIFEEGLEDWTLPWTFHHSDLKSTPRMREFENWEKTNILDIIGNFWDNIGYLILHKPVESLASDVSLTRVWCHWQEMMMCTLGDLRVLKNFVNRWDLTWPAKFKE